MLLKMYGLGVNQYFQSSFNIFDFVVRLRWIRRSDSPPLRRLVSGHRRFDLRGDLDAFQSR